MNRLPACLAALLVTACAAPLPRPDPAMPTPVVVAPAPRPVPAATEVPERYVSAENPLDELDSLATWVAEDGRTRLIATAKSTHRLVMFDGDSGERLREVGGPGATPGRFMRPNGIAVHGDHVVVAERDNRRIQVLALPGFEPVGSFGQDELRAPYGLWVTESEPGELDVYVTDGFMYGARFDQVPPPAELSQRVRRYRLQIEDGALRAQSAGSFGDTAGGALRVVESIGGDPDNDRLLIADEAGAGGSTLREYTLGGRYTGRSLPEGTFSAQAEGVVLWDCPGGAGYWITVDQLAPLTVFHVLDRRTLAPRGSFRGRVTSHTDGVALHAAATPSFPGGVLYAVHDDRAVSAFDLRDVSRRLGLDTRCTR